MEINIETVRKQTPAVISDNETDAINRMLASAELYGYGNFMSWLATAWKKKVPQMRGESIPVNGYPLDWLK